MLLLAFSCASKEAYKPEKLVEENSVPIYTRKLSQLHFILFDWSIAGNSS